MLFSFFLKLLFYSFKYNPSMLLLSKQDNMMAQSTHVLHCTLNSGVSWKIIMYKSINLNVKPA